MNTLGDFFKKCICCKKTCKKTLFLNHRGKYTSFCENCRIGYTRRYSENKIKDVDKDVERTCKVCKGKYSYEEFLSEDIKSYRFLTKCKKCQGINRLRRVERDYLKREVKICKDCDVEYPIKEFRNDLVYNYRYLMRCQTCTKNLEFKIKSKSCIHNIRKTSCLDCFSNKKDTVLELSIFLKKCKVCKKTKSVDLYKDSRGFLVEVCLECRKKSENRYENWELIETGGVCNYEIFSGTLFLQAADFLKNRMMLRDMKEGIFTYVGYVCIQYIIYLVSSQNMKCKNCNTILQFQTSLGYNFWNLGKKDKTKPYIQNNIFLECSSCKLN